MPSTTIAPSRRPVPQDTANESFVGRVLGQFRRITSSGQFIPEIDGLRFIAILSVVLYHVHFYLSQANHYQYAAPNESFKRFLTVFQHGSLGVDLFFVISGFILALPFAFYFLKGRKAVSLRQYYLRRVTRLEPPYMVVMILCFLLIAHRIHSHPDFPEYRSSFIASLFYSHNLIWPRGTLPLVNPVAWSLEIEIQFYILAPLIAYVYTLKKWNRRGLLLALILAKLCIPVSDRLPHTSLLDFYDYFLMGFILADLFVSNALEAGKHELLYLAGAVLSFALVWFCGLRFLALEIGLFYFCALKSSVVRAFLGNRWIATMGGMCYSLYLIHWMLITTLGNRVAHKFTNSYACDFVIQAALFLVLILVVGAIYFRLIERPCMARDWHKRLFGFLKPARMDFFAHKKT